MQSLAKAFCRIYILLSAAERRKDFAGLNFVLNMTTSRRKHRNASCRRTFGTTKLVQTLLLSALCSPLPGDLFHEDEQMRDH